MKNQTAEEITKKLCGSGVNSTNRLATLLALTANQDPEVFWRVFHENWSVCDNTWDLRDDILSALEWFDDGDYMPHEQRTFLSGLETDRYSRITVYRGCSRSRIPGLSWTTNPNVAQDFAQGHRGIGVPDPVVVKAKIRKSNVITVILDRQEDEIILNPIHLRCLRETKLQPARMLNLTLPEASSTQGAMLPLTNSAATRRLQNAQQPVFSLMARKASSTSIHR